MDGLMLMNIAGFLLGASGLFVALMAVAIALWQVRDTRRVSKLEGEIIALEAFLAAELAGRRDHARIEKLLELIFAKVEQLGAKGILEEEGILGG